VSAPAPFQIVSGSSFSLLPGQPQEVVVRFSSATAGSFSPAQLDFGSGLLVLREQCDNKMGTCRLGTEKLGLPIEKVLMVKNEGSVAVSLTLSTAAPYKIVSVLPTLSPGQSGQVTLRFDPSESGSFTGTVQVGINGGQGSVSSPPLVGTAHKIEIDPAELDFGIVFVGSTREQKLTVKNQGVTTVPLTVSTSAPFSIVSGSSFTLAPSEIREVAIQISPTASGSFSGNVQLASGSVSFKVPVKTDAMTYEEYLQALLAGANALARYGNYNVSIAESWQNPCLQVLAGFDNLSTEIIQRYVSSTECEDIAGIDSARIAELKRAFELLEALGADRITSWLHTLKQALAEERFDEEYERLLPEGLGQFMEAMRLLSNLTNFEEVKDQLRAWLLVQEQIDPLAYAHLLQDRVSEFLRRNLFLITEASFNLHIRPMWDQLITRLMTLSGFSNEVYRASHALYWICISFYYEPGFVEELIAFLSWMDSAQRIEQGLGTLLAAGNAASQGWHVKGFKPITGVYGRTAWTAELTMTAQKAYELGILIPMTRLGPDNKPYSLTGIHVVVLGHHCEQCGSLPGQSTPQQIVDWIEQALRRYGETFTRGSGELNVFIVSFTRENPQGVRDVINALAAEFGGINAVIMVVWIENGEVKWACISAGCSSLTPEEQAAIARSFANLLSKYPSGMIETLMGFCGGDVGCIINILMAGK
jgi:sugar phosphate isomerase/epimerase